MEVTYYYTDDCGSDTLMKKVRDPEKGIFTGYIWNISKNIWVENWELTCGYFFGFEPARKVNEADAIMYMTRYGMTRQEAEKQIDKDWES